MISLACSLAAVTDSTMKKAGVSEYPCAVHHGRYDDQAMHGVSINEPLAPGQQRNWTVAIQAAGTPDSSLPQWGVQDHASHELSVRLRDPGGGMQPLGRAGIITVRYCTDAAACGCGVRVDGGAGVTIAGSFACSGWRFNPSSGDLPFALQTHPPTGRPKEVRSGLLLDVSYTQSTH